MDDDGQQPEEPEPPAGRHFGFRACLSGRQVSDFGFPRRARLRRVRPAPARIPASSWCPTPQPPLPGLLARRAVFPGLGPGLRLGPAPRATNDRPYGPPTGHMKLPGARRTGVGQPGRKAPGRRRTHRSAPSGVIVRSARRTGVGQPGRKAPDACRTQRSAPARAIVCSPGRKPGESERPLAPAPSGAVVTSGPRPAPSNRRQRPIRNPKPACRTGRSEIRNRERPPRATVGPRPTQRGSR